MSCVSPSDVHWITAKWKGGSNRGGKQQPEDYNAFLRISNGFNDEVGAGYLVLWSVAELARVDGYDLFEFQSDRFLIGSNGGPTAYGIIGRDYISIPFVFAGP